MNTALSQPPYPAAAPVAPISEDGAATHPWLAALCSSSLAAFILVLGAHAAALGLMFYPSASAPTIIELPTIQGILIPAPPAETVQLPSAQETPPPVETPPPEPVKPKPQPKPKPKPEEVKPAPVPEPVVEAPPSETAITAEAAQEEAAQEESAPAEPLPVTTTAEENSTLGAPVTPPQEDAHQLNNPRPAYPSISRSRREEGTVLLEVLILANGTVGEVRIKESSGYSRLDQTAMRAVKRWRYLPARRGTETIDYWYLQPIEFALN